MRTSHQQPTGLNRGAPQQRTLGGMANAPPQDGTPQSPSGSWSVASASWSDAEWDVVSLPLPHSDGEALLRQLEAFLPHSSGPDEAQDQSRAERSLAALRAYLRDLEHRAEAAERAASGAGEYRALAARLARTNAQLRAAASMFAVAASATPRARQARRAAQQSDQRVMRHKLKQERLLKHPRTLAPRRADRGSRPGCARFV
mmetsp:Transcript_8301/g.26324  ORF Transcript_8301/g.26324 Transcript_8301/m.26324 type:complete len:202 (-) Transcript_8301:318-923(-)